MLLYTLCGHLPVIEWFADKMKIMPYFFNVTRGKIVQTLVNDLQNGCHNPFTLKKKIRAFTKRKSEVIMCSLTTAVYILAQMLAEGLKSWASHLMKTGALKKKWYIVLSQLFIYSFSLYFKEIFDKVIRR